MSTIFWPEATRNELRASREGILIKNEIEKSDGGERNGMAEGVGGGV